MGPIIDVFTREIVPEPMNERWEEDIAIRGDTMDAWLSGEIEDLG